MSSANTMVGFIGAGNMAYSICAGMIQTGVVRKENVIASAPTMRNLEKIKDLGCAVTRDNAEVVRKCDVILLCVKPFKVKEVMVDDPYLRGTWRPEQLVISVISGIKMNHLQELTGLTKIIRTVPNTPMQVQAGVLAYCLNGGCDKQDEVILQHLFSRIAICRKVSEDQLNAVVGLAGSGPAFVYTVIQALSDGGLKMGLPRNLATELAAQTVMGASKMVLETGLHPGELKDAVCSPAGTTISGVHALERAAVRSAFMDAVEAATNVADAQGRQK